LRSCLLIAALVWGCATPPPALRSTRLFVHEREGAVIPLIHASVAGKELYLLIDTGAPKNILPESFVTAAGLKPSKNWVGLTTDANGAGVLMKEVTDVAVRFDGQQSPSALDFLMGDFTAGGVGILAPQTLVNSGWALTIDLLHERLRIDPEEDALQRLRESSAKVEELSFRRCTGEPTFDTTHRVIQATVNGFPAAMLVDTGAARTAMFDDNPARMSVAGMKAKKLEIVGVNSGGGKGKTVDDLPVTFAGMTLRLTTTLVPGKHSCGQGVIGADVLRHCQLVWTKSSLWASCSAG
jgi:predicted aspartyl protease